MHIIGVAGTTGSGKTTLLDNIKLKGGYVIDCDKVYHRLLEIDGELRKELISEFGRSIIVDGAIDTKELGKIVLGHKDKLNRLNEISHRHICDKVESIIEEKKRDYKIIAIDAPLLFETRLASICTTTIAVLASTKLRLKRIMERDSIAEEYAMARINSQKPNIYFIERCNHVIINNYNTREEYEKQVDRLIDKILN